uniref:Uncharacterized protein n=1 Tax=Oryza meridionalis TaxID=40149 RepID=A0A0E0CXR3_9ORYZ
MSRAKILHRRFVLLGKKKSGGPIRPTSLKRIKCVTLFSPYPVFPLHNQSEIEREGGGGDFVRKREAAATSCARGRATGQRRQCPPFSILLPLIPPPADPFPFSILLPLIRRRAGSWLSCSCTSSSQSRARSSRLSPRFFRLSRPA